MIELKARRRKARTAKGKPGRWVLAAIEANIRAGITAEGERNLAICAAKANAVGMSYGQYMAARREGRTR